MQHCERAEFFTEVVHERAHIGALADYTAQRALLGVLVEVQQLHFMHDDVARRAFDLPALACKVVQLLAVDLYRRVHRRDLLLRSDKAAHRTLHRIFRRDPVAGLHDLAGHILRIRAVAERKARDILLVLRCGEIRRLGRAADEHRQNAGRERIERAAVTDFPRVQDAAQLGHHIMRGEALRLVHQQDTRKLSLLHGTAPSLRAASRPLPRPCRR